MKGNTILVLDFGAQYAQLIANAVRRSGAYSEIHPHTISLKKIDEINPAGIILSGGPASVKAENAPMPDPEIFNLGIPIMGICYGHQAMAVSLGGTVEKSEAEYGKCFVKLLSRWRRRRTPYASSGLPLWNQVWMSHEDSVVTVPKGFQVIASSERCPVAGMFNPVRKFLSFQFHPEVEHTHGGQKLMNYFTKKLCQAADWSMPDFVYTAINKIQEEVCEESVIGGVSGGVDSMTAALLMERAIGNRFTAIFVNNGLLRKGEAEQVIATMTRLGINFKYADVPDRFLSLLKGIIDPDQKRKIIGNEFIRVFEEEAGKIASEKGLAKIPFLVQGTLYPDVIESVSADGGPTAKIKRHHNVGGLPDDMDLKLIEPFRRLFKDEVREVGRELGLPEEIVGRHPFPGPGVAIRIIGEVTKKRVALLQEVDAIFIDEIRYAGLYDSIGQAFPVLTGVKTVGVQGDGGTYKETVALRSVDTTVFMTAEPTEFPKGFIRTVANRITNELEDIGRVVYDYSSKPPSTIEWE